MFYPHLSEIDIKRDEPEKVDMGYVRERNARIAFAVVTKDLFKTTKKNKNIKKKLKALTEFDEREKIAQKFLEIWNEWRLRYFEVSPVKIKNKGQITTIEKIKQLAKDENIKVEILIACTHRAYIKRRLRPGFTDCLSRGMEYYSTFKEDVIADIDRWELEDEQS